MPMKRLWSVLKTISVPTFPEIVVTAISGTCVAPATRSKSAIAAQPAGLDWVCE